MKPHFLLDLEIQDLHTVDHAALAQSILEGIELAPPPFRIALFGPWGSGKSTILKMVQAHTEEENGKDENGNGMFIKPLWFNAWEYESHNNLLMSLISLLTAEIPDGVRYSRKGSKVVRQVALTTETLGRRWSHVTGAAAPATGRPTPQGEHVTNDISDVQTMKSAFRKLVDFTLVQSPKHKTRRLVIFVDDLDKCLPVTVLTFLEGLKLFLDRGTPVILVFALDRDVLSTAIRRKYTREMSFDTDRYIEKIFEFSYDVPPITIGQLGPLVGELYERAGLRQAAGNGRSTAAELAAIERVLSHPGLHLSPRKIKRIFNKFVWFFASRHRLELHPPRRPESSQTTLPGTGAPPVEAEDELPVLDYWLTWLLTSEYWRDFRSLVIAHGEPALGELCNRVTGNPLFPHANQTVRARFEQLPDVASLLEYYRYLFDASGAAHLPHVQTRMRARVHELARIDRILHLNGV